MITKEQALAKKVTDDFLDNIKDLPEWVELYKINHHSPSQLNAADDMWSYKYLYLTQEQRRKLPINSKMFAGVCLGDMGILTFGKYLWESKIGKGLCKVEIPPQRKIFDKILEKYNAYEPVDELDKAQHDAGRLGLAKSFQTLKAGPHHLFKHADVHARISKFPENHMKEHSFSKEDVGNDIGCTMMDDAIAEKGGSKIHNNRRRNNQELGCGWFCGFFKACHLIHQNT